MRGDFARPLRAAANLAGLFSVVWIVGYTLTTNRWVMQLYRLNDGTPAHSLAGKLGDAQAASGKVCLLLGPSTVREGFDEAAMAEALPGVRFLNAGTIGYVLAFEPMALMVEQSGVEPYCIVLGLNSRMLISRPSRLYTSGYTDFLDWFNGRQPLQRSRVDRVPARREILINTWWPYKRVARQLGRWIRYGLRQSRERVERWAKGTTDAPSPVPSVVDRPFPPELWQVMLRQYALEGMYVADNYGWPEHLALLRGTLDQLAARTDRLLVIEMPEHSYGREHFAPLGEASFRPVMEEFEARGGCLVDMTTWAPDDWFRDFGHLLLHRRAAFSRRAAGEIGSCLDRFETRPRSVAKALGAGH